MASGRFNNQLMDVTTRSLGKPAGPSIAFHGRGPLYLIGGHYSGDIALGSTVVYDHGARFGPGAGYVKLFDGARISVRTPQAVLTKSVLIARGHGSVEVTLEGLEKQRDEHYAVVVTPGWDAGSRWVTGKSPDGFTANFRTPPPADAHLDVRVVPVDIIPSPRGD